MPVFRGNFEVSQDLLDDLKSKFFEEINSDPKEREKYHPDDIQRVKENEYFIARYLLHQDLNLDSAFRMLKESLKFRKDMEVNTLTKEDLPDDYFEARTLQIYNKDKHGHPVMVVRCKAHKKNSEETHLHQQYMLYWIEKGVRSADWGGLAILFDCTGSSYKNLDLDMTRFLLNVFKQYYPWSMYIFLVYNMPWYMSAIWKLVRSWIPEKHSNRVVLIDKNTIFDYIDKDQLPVCLGGTCTDQYDSKDVEESSTGWF